MKLCYNPSLPIKGQIAEVNCTMMVMRTLFLMGWLAVASDSVVLAWSEGGHHLIAQMAFNRLDLETQNRLVALLEKYPRYKEDFKKPDHITPEEYGGWLVGRAAFWPDVARRTEWDRPNWHFQLGSSLNIGDVSSTQVPNDPSGLPADATLITKNLYIVQAYDLCPNVLKFESAPEEDKAVALCWVLHLAGDAHQPCHAGSLYQKDVFPNGDRGGNSIPTVQLRNIHALWDGLLGPRYDRENMDSC